MKLIEAIAAVVILGGLFAFIGGMSVVWGIVGMACGFAALLIASRKQDDADADGFAQRRMDDDGAPTDLGRWPFTKGEDNE